MTIFRSRLLNDDGSFVFRSLFDETGAEQFVPVDDNWRRNSSPAIMSHYSTTEVTHLFSYRSTTVMQIVENFL